MTHLMTSPGVPLIYYGDEYGEFGGQDPDNRHMLTATANLNAQQKNQVARMKSLLTARAQLRGLRRGSLKQLWCNADRWGSGSGNLMAYARADSDPKESAVVVLNLTDATWAGVSVDAREALGWSGGTVVDALSGRTYSLNNGSMVVDVPGRGAALLHLQ